jgi:hypothetical protein
VRLVIGQWASLIGGKGWWRYVEAATVQAEKSVVLVTGNRPHHFGEWEKVMIGIGMETVVVVAVHNLRSQHR